MADKQLNALKKYALRSKAPLISEMIKTAGIDQIISSNAILVPSINTEDDFNSIISLMNYISENYVNPDNSQFADIGAGEGSVGFIANYFGFKSNLYEINDSLITAINKGIKELDIKDKIKVHKGDWKETLNENTNPSFEDINFFYSYQLGKQGFSELINKVSKYSKDETVLAIKMSPGYENTVLPNNLKNIGIINSELPIYMFKKIK